MASGFSTRFLPHNDDRLNRIGGGCKIRDAVKALMKRCSLDLEAGSTLDADAGVDEGSLSSGGEALTGRHLARRRRPTVMSRCSGPVGAGMHVSGAGSYSEGFTVKNLTNETYAETVAVFERETPADVLKSTDAHAATVIVEHAHYLFRKSFHLYLAKRCRATFVAKRILFGKRGSRKIPGSWKALKGHGKRAPPRSRQLKTFPEVATLAGR